MSHILAIDQGTTSTRALLYDARMQVVATAQREFAQHFPQSGWVEHVPQDLWQTTLETCREVLEKAGIAAREVLGIGLTNQRETTIVWDKLTGEPVYNAIVWQDRRTADLCQSLRDAGLEPEVKRATGLLLDPYFSATKVKWILDHVEGARERAAWGELLFGTVDSFLIWRLTGGAVHATDATNAARTMLYDIRKGGWSAEICAALDIPMQMLPQVHDCAAYFGLTQTELLGASIPILGVAGDQQAAALGQACFAPGMLKSTYGTGCFALLNTGATIVESRNRLLTTIAYQLDGKPAYALEGSIFIAGAAVQWLRDGLGVIGQASETQRLAQTADPAQSLILVPAFTGLGAPYWNPECRGAIFGLTRNSGPAELARAALECVGFQTRDLLEAMRADWGGNAALGTLRVDGGMSASDYAMQFLADVTGGAVDRPRGLETTALGAAWLAGMRAGVFPQQDQFARQWRCGRQFLPTMSDTVRSACYAAWKSAVAATLVAAQNRPA